MSNYREWAARIPPTKIHTYADACISRLAHEAARLFDLPEEEAAWLTGVTAALRYTHPGLVRPGADPVAGDFVFVWATVSPDMRKAPSPSIHINESRFARWLEAAPRAAEMIDQWFDHTLEALRVIKGMPFNIESLLHIARTRANEPDSPAPGQRLGTMSQYALEFYHHQPTGIHGARPEAQTPTAQIAGAK